MNKPTLTQIAAGLRAVQARDGKEALKRLKAAQKWSIFHGFNLVEIGWQLLRLKEAVPHGNIGNQHASKNKNDKLSLLFSGGFEAGVEAEFGIDPKNAQRWMNAARNLGLSAESTEADMRRLRRSDALEGVALSKLYRLEQEEELSLDEQFRQARLMAEIAFTHGRSGIVPRVQELVIQKASFAHLPPEQIELVYHTLREATEKIAAHRKPKLVRRAA